MMTQNTDTVSIESTESTKLTLNERTENRIAFHVAAGLKKSERLAKLEVGSKAHTKCLDSIRKNDELLAALRTQLAARLEKAVSNDSASDSVTVAA